MTGTLTVPVRFTDPTSAYAETFPVGTRVTISSYTGLRTAWVQVEGTTLRRILHLPSHVAGTV